ncbi:MAG: hypothetical protein HOP13_14030 [Alphaproteobacteria bacterium]|nr:hypothetical protein [Alphaproteobacteria bacterium]
MADKRITLRTKVYMTRIGVRDWLVAADSQKAALQAWDVHRNLFSTGEARITNDAAHVALAMKAPGLPVPAPGRVQVPEEKGRVSNVVRLAAARPGRVEAPKAKDTSKLDAVEEELRAFERDAKRARTEIEKRKRAVETELEAFDAAAERKRILLAKRIKREQEALK